MLCYALLKTNDISTKENNLSEVESSYVNINSLRYDALCLVHIRLFSLLLPRLRGGIHIYTKGDNFALKKSLYSTLLATSTRRRPEQNRKESTSPGKFAVVKFLRAIELWLKKVINVGTIPFIQLRGIDMFWPR